MATTQYSIRLVKTFPYRGDTAQRFSNRYYFDGGAVGDTSAMQALMDAWVAAEKAIFNPAVTIIEASVYGPSSGVALATKSYATAGTLSSSGVSVPGDCAAVLRMATTKVSTKNHPVFVFSYYHRALKASSDTTGDTLSADMKTAIETYGTALKDGITVGGRTYKRTTPDGHATTGRLVDQYIGHRDFPR